MTYGLLRAYLGLPVYEVHCPAWFMPEVAFPSKRVPEALLVSYIRLTDRKPANVLTTELHCCYNVYGSSENKCICVCRYSIGKGGWGVLCLLSLRSSPYRHLGA